MPLPEAIKAWRAELAQTNYAPPKDPLVNFGPRVPPGPSILAQYPLPYEHPNAEVQKTLKWAWKLLTDHFQNQGNDVLWLVVEPLKAGDIDLALRTLAIACCEGEVVDNGGEWLDVDYTLIPALKPILDQLPRIESVWRKALESEAA